MAQQVIRIYEDPALQIKLVGNARKKAENFTWNKIKESWYSTLESLC
jgi:glycosyltransferase involved in cell wall biosynthesis